MHRVTRYGWTILLMAVLTGCTDVKLEEIPPEPVYRDDKIEIHGHLCTREPETLTFPLRVLFVVDGSVSMQVMDPPDPVTGETGRERAVRETWTELLDQGPEGARVGIMRFSSQAQSRTAVDEDGDSLPDTFFTADRMLLTAATQALAVTDRTTNYANALGEAYFEIRNELLAADQESLPLSKYIVIFLSDGIPDTDDADSRGNASDEILEAVGAVRELAETFRVGDFSFHTAYLSGGQVGAFDLRAQELLQRMAETGGGTFRSFASGEELNFLFVDFTVLKRVFTMRSIAAVNLNAVMDHSQIPTAAQLNPVEPVEGLEVEVVEEEETELASDAEETEIPPVNELAFIDLNTSTQIECGEPMVDTDGDGLADLMEVVVGTEPLLRDTDDDGLNDHLEWEFSEAGLDPLVNDASCYIPNRCIDEDTDGFCDCTLDLDQDGTCDCTDDVEEPCLDEAGHDCLDEDEDGWCDCPDRDEDGRCDYVDFDGDRLHDCEEVFFGTAQNGNDSDADGLPDLMEVRFRTNPTEADDRDDSDFDRALNGMEVLANTSPQCDDASLRSRIAYRYNLEDLGLVGATSCYDFSITNITLVPTLANTIDPEARYPGNGANQILVYAGEVAFDDPTAFAAYRVACVVASYNPRGGYKNPPSGAFHLTEEDFVGVAEFDPDTHCIYP